MLSSFDANTPFYGALSSGDDYLKEFLGPPRTPEYIGTLHRYDVDCEIGRGGMGVVFRAYDDSLRRHVAIKVLAPEIAASVTARERFRREAHAAASISDHDSVVTIYEVGEYNRLPYLSMQYVRGCSLQGRLDSDGPLSETQIRQVGLQLAEALDFAHRNGLIHRDIKPSNILLDEQVQRARLADFGLARWMDDATLTVSGTIMGTVAYMAPEQAQGEVADERSDLYSLGAVLYASAIGRPPFEASSPLALLRKVCDEIPEQIDQLDAALSPDLSRLIQGLLTKDPTTRLQSAAEVAQLISSESRRDVSGWTRFPGGIDAGAVAPSSLEPLSEFLGRPVGFDIGAKSSHVSYLNEDEKLQVVPISGKRSTPTLLLARDGRVLMGSKALAAARQNAVGLVERLAGRIGSEQSKIDFLGNDVPVEALLALLIGSIADDARKQIGYFSHVCYTIPGCYGDPQRKSLRDTLNIASLNFVQPLTCSSAIAIDFLFQKGLLIGSVNDQPCHVLVVRCGASSFDATILRLQRSTLETIALAGDTSLGGRLWDRRIAKHVISHIQRKYGREITQDPTAMFLLLQECEAAKAGLNPDGILPIRFHGESSRFEGRVKRNFLKKISTDLLARVEQRAQEALQEARVEWADLDYVLLAGGVARLPDFRKLFRDLCRNSENCFLGDFDSAANGAAIFAHQQMQTDAASRGFEIREKATFDYSVKSDMLPPESRPFISRGTPLPTTAEFELNLAKAKPDSSFVKVLECGGSTDHKERTVGQCIVRDLQSSFGPDKAIYLTLHLDESGVLGLTGKSAVDGNGLQLHLVRPNCIPDAHVGYWKHWLQSILTSNA